MCVGQLEVACVRAMSPRLSRGPCWMEPVRPNFGEHQGHHIYLVALAGKQRASADKQRRRKKVKMRMVLN